MTNEADRELDRKMVECGDGKVPISGASGRGVLLQRAIRLVFGEELMGFHPLRGGGARDSYFVETEGQQLVVRVSRAPLESSQSEAVAMGIARSHGLPVAHVLHLGVLDDTPRGLHFLIHEFLAGDPLDTDREHRRPSAALLRKAGEILADLHRIPLRGYGPLRADARGSCSRWTDIIGDWEGKVRARGGEPYRSLGVREEDVARRMRWLADLAGDVPGALLHGEFKLGHLLVHRQAISGLIDFECALAGDPILDLARWRTTFPSPETWDPVLEGYRSRRSLPADVDLRLALYGIRLATEVGLYAQAKGLKRRWEQLQLSLSRDLAATA